MFTNMFLIRLLLFYLFIFVICQTSCWFFRGRESTGWNRISFPLLLYPQSSLHSYCFWERRDLVFRHQTNLEPRHRLQQLGQGPHTTSETKEQNKNTLFHFLNMLVVGNWMQMHRMVQYWFGCTLKKKIPWDKASIVNSNSSHTIWSEHI